MKARVEKLIFIFMIGMLIPLYGIGSLNVDAATKKTKNYYRYVKVNFTYGRALPKPEAEVVTTFKIGRKVTCCGKKGGYTKVIYKGAICYVNTKTLTKHKLATTRIFKKTAPRKFINYIGPIARRDYKKSGVLASVTVAQAILESGYGRTKLAQKANNLFGMKRVISNNTWEGTVWAGKYYRKRTAEYKAKTNKKYYITADFRKYNSIAASIADHSAYLTNAKNGENYRYAGLTKTKSYKKQTAIIKRGGYATNKYYAKHLCQIIKHYNLTRFDKR